MRNLFICRTPYQLLIASMIVLTQYTDDINDVAIVDTIADSERLITSVRASGVFNHVILADFKKKYAKKNRLYFFMQGILSKLGYIQNPFEERVSCYDRLYFSNISLVNSLVFRKLKSMNKSLCTYMFEDGFANASSLFKNFFAGLNNKSGIINKVVFFLRKQFLEAFVHLDGYYLCSPELLDWEIEIPVFSVEKIDPSDKALVEKLNSIYGFTCAEECYDNPYIFFEESYYADKIEIADLDIIKQVQKEILPDKLTVKIHPRNPTNRFRELGIQTNEDTFFPWEVIALNIDLSQKVLITIASSSALSSLLNSGIKPKRVIMLMNCQELPDEKLSVAVPLFRKVASHFPDIVYLPDRLFPCDWLVEEEK